MDIWKEVPLAIRDIGTLATEAMLLEANCAPAPGLVDRFNSGAHNDMDIYTFIQSSVALSPYMYNFAYTGYMYTGTLDHLLEVIRPIGIEAEQTMFSATNDVNTQKGLIFLLGILCTVSGFVYRKYNVLKSSIILDVVQEMCKNLVKNELQSMTKQKSMTAGECLYKKYGIRGIRGELEDGLPALRNIALPAYKEAVEFGVTKDRLLIHVLLAIMTVTEDTTIVHRHDLDVLLKVQKDAKEILCNGGALDEQSFNAVKELDQEYIKAWISPGGSADLLAATHFLYSLEQRYSKGG